MGVDLDVDDVDWCRGELVAEEVDDAAGLVAFLFREAGEFGVVFGDILLVSRTRGRRDDVAGEFVLAAARFRLIVTLALSAFSFSPSISLSFAPFGMRSSLDASFVDERESAERRSFIFSDCLVPSIIRLRTFLPDLVVCRSSPPSESLFRSSSSELESLSLTFAVCLIIFAFSASFLFLVGVMGVYFNFSGSRTLVSVVIKLPFLGITL